MSLLQPVLKKKKNKKVCAPCLLALTLISLMFKTYFFGIWMYRRPAESSSLMA